jgi:septal ring factor EnvC (AmiA/AmiB activator)
MNELSEGKEINGKIFLNGWFRITLCSFAGLVMVILTTLSTHVIANDKDSRQRDTNIRELVAKNSLSIAELKSIQYKLNSIDKNLNEINGVLIRTAPYERKKSSNN